MDTLWRPLFCPSQFGFTMGAEENGLAMEEGKEELYN